MTQPTAPLITIVPARPAIAAGRVSTIDFLIRIEAPAPQARANRRPLNFGIVLDRSGSMAGMKLREAKAAVAYAITHMPDDDLVSLTIYDQKVQTLVEPTPVQQARGHILELLPAIEDGGTTALHTAWVQGGTAVSRHFDPQRLNRVLLISDGLANVGVTNPDTIVTQAGELHQRGVSTSTLGVGPDFNEDLMIPMAVAGGGAGWFAESPEDFTRIFEAELAGLASQYAERAILKLEPRRAGTKIAEILNDLPDDPAGGYVLGNLNHGQPLNIVARIEAHGGETGQPLDLFDVRLALDVRDQGRIELQQLARVQGADPAEVEAMPVNPEVDRAVELLLSARARKEAIHHLDRGDVQAAMALSAGWTDRLSERFSMAREAEIGEDAVAFDEVFQALKEAPNSEAAGRFARKLASYQRYRRTQKGKA